MKEKRNILQWIEFGLEKFGEGICSIGSIFTKNWRWAMELRKVLMAAPVVVAMLALAGECRKRLPEMVGINLLASGDFERMVSRESAISATMAITILSLVLMFFSRKTVYLWLISLLSLLLPIILIVTNIFPA